VLDTIRSEVMGDLQDPYGAILRLPSGVTVPPPRGDAGGSAPTRAG
jgi:hypothetical protein